MFRAAALPGFLATTGAVPPRIERELGDAERIDEGPLHLRHWGLRAGPSEPSEALILSRVRRRSAGAVAPSEIDRAMRADPSALASMLPPFAAAAAAGTGVRLVADSMGFRPLFHSDPGATGEALVSSSALLAGWARSAPLDSIGVGVQSLLGWQLGQRTLFEGIGKLTPGAVGFLDGDGVRTEEAAQRAAEPIGLESAVAESAALLRTSLAALLDDHPDAVLQLTGGLDSRLLLSAIPAARRRGLRAMTLSVPGTGDVAIASAIAQRYGIVHDVQGLADVDAVRPDEAWRLVCAEAVRLEAMSDPVALAAQRIAERHFDQGVRISGLGGEIARGFYYVGRVRDRTFSRRDAERLASWRMLVNEAVEPGLLTDAFSAWARDAANEQVWLALSAGGEEWFRATDWLYLRHRMQRWAGLTDVAVSDRRMVVNPMLDHGFIEIAERLAPRDKAHSRFLALLQLELDPELGRIPLDGRPAPSAYAHPGALEPVTRALSSGRRVSRKAAQRLRRGNRPPAGGTVLAAKVVAHWRAQPEVVSSLAALDFVREGWVDRMLLGEIEPRPSSVGFLTNLIVATGPAS